MSKHPVILRNAVTFMGLMGRSKSAGGKNLGEHLKLVCVQAAAMMAIFAVTPYIALLLKHQFSFRNMGHVYPVAAVIWAETAQACPVHMFFHACSKPEYSLVKTCSGYPNWPNLSMAEMDLLSAAAEKGPRASSKAYFKVYSNHVGRVWSRTTHLGYTATGV